MLNRLHHCNLAQYSRLPPYRLIRFSLTNKGRKHLLVCSTSSMFFNKDFGKLSETQTLLVKHVQSMAWTRRRCPKSICCGVVRASLFLKNPSVQRTSGPLDNSRDEAYGSHKVHRCTTASYPLGFTASHAPGSISIVHRVLVKIGRHHNKSFVENVTCSNQEGVEKRRQAVVQ